MEFFNKIIKRCYTVRLRTWVHYYELYTRTNYYNIVLTILYRRRSLTGEIRRQIDHYGQRSGRGSTANRHGQQ